jgi:hypothetical protein
MEFRATIALDGRTATGIPVPEDVVAALGGGKRPRVRVSFAGVSYQTTVARMRGEYKFPVSAAIRDQAGVAAGDEVAVTIELDEAPRVVTVPDDLAEALGRHGARRAFDALSYTNRKRHVVAVEGAKTPETRQRRIAKVVAEVGAPAAGDTS